MKLETIKRRLAEIIREEFIDEWLGKPNDAFRGSRPIDLVGTDRERELLDMITRIEHGIF